MATATDETTREAILERLRAHDEVRFALLFGSRTCDRPTRTDSDWDVAVFVGGGSTPRDRFDLRRRLTADLDEIAPTDVVVLDDAPALLGHRALQGELLFARDRVAYVRYFVRTIAASEDERYYRDIHRRARERRLAEGTFGRP